MGLAGGRISAIGVGGYEAFARDHGHATGDLPIAWLLANPVVCSVITGVTSPEQLEANVKAAEWKLTPEQHRDLDQRD